jgi:hypothetical protein
MFLKKLAQNKTVTIDYDKNGTVHTTKGRVFHLNLREQYLSLRDEKQKTYSIRLSGIRKVY